MKQIKYTINTLAPVLISSESGNQFMVPTKDYIPGLNILGALAAKYIKREGQPNYLNPQKSTDTDFYSWFVEGGLSFSNAYKVDAISDNEKSPTIPLPLSVHHIKNEEEKVLDLLYAPSEEQTKSFGGFGLLSGSKLYKTKIGKSTSPHHERDYKTGAPKKNIFFNYESIDTNQEFKGTVTGKEELLNQFYDRFKEINQLRIGRSRTTEYGKVEFSLSEISDITSDEIKLNDDGTISLTFLSNVILYNDNGYPSCSYKDLEKYIKNKLPGAEIINPFLRAEEIENYISVWKLKKPSEISFQAGCCLLLKIGNGNTEKLKQLQEAGIGERKHEGFGRIIFGLQRDVEISLQGDAEIHKKEKKYKKPENIPISEKVADTVKVVAKDYLNNIAAVEAWTIVKSKELNISTSQVSRLEGFVRIANTNDDFKNSINFLRKSFKDKLEGCDFDGTNLFLFLTKENILEKKEIKEAIANIEKVFNDVSVDMREIDSIKNGLFKVYYLTLFAAMRKSIKGGN
jgi:CRISPR-associated protein Csx10